MQGAAQRWDETFSSKADDELSWFEAEPTISMRLVHESSPGKGPLIDVGAGRSLLVERLLDAGWSDLTALDVSEVALGAIRQRLGERARTVSFICSDVRDWRPNRRFATWHDRAVLHFLVDSDDRDRYVENASNATVATGALVLATFAADGPTQCSGLPTCRYDPDDLGRLFERSFVLEHAEREEHTTPSGFVQPFTWVVLRRR